MANIKKLTEKNKLKNIERFLYSNFHIDRKHSGYQQKS